MKQRRTEGRLLGVAVLALLVPAAGTATAATAQPPELRLNALAVNLSGIGRVDAQPLEIVIDRWSSDEEHDKLLDTLKNKGSESLLDQLEAVKPRAGYIRTRTSLGWDIQYAREETLPDGGRRIVFATDRPISFFELWNRPRSADYEFMVCEIRLGKDGSGEGELTSVAKVSFDKEKNRVEIENYGIEPVRLTRVTVET